MNDTQLTFTRRIPVSIEDVWRAWTDPKQLVQWKSPEGMTTPKATVDLRVGGLYEITMYGIHSGNTEPSAVVVGGEYLEIQKPTKLSFTWAWVGDHEKTTVTVLLKPLSPEETELTLIHEGFLTEASRTEHGKGWTSTLNHLDAFLK
jgi:uncharacterized protein YndB with AHSA1/START domain